ncbi:MEKHLA domain-containing protein [Methyloglobulus sp.]|uniref:MEKHLA domain-containing protein n=1 Tax=Methyloglobulus sp. TaxID=2518622 RepID=UPI0018297A3C|nr:MEKHLA domain-containing protein [Methyloglobulus sp.]
MNYPSETNHFLSDHVTLLSNSYQKLLGGELISKNHTHDTLAKALFYAPFVVVSHNTATDPVFNYANLKALELFGFNWEEFTQLPSKLSAESIHQLERDKLLAEVSQNGYLASYQGIRITKTGSRFLIKNAVVWNLVDDDGNYAGQAAKFEDWEFL